MRWPKLVPPSVCRVPVQVWLTEGLEEDGAPAERLVFEGLCNYSEKARQVLDAERRLVRLEAVALMDGDIAPGMEQLEGYVRIWHGKIERAIYRSSRARNPDGTVNFTQLELM